MSAGTNGNAARGQAEPHPVMDRRVFSVCRLPERRIASVDRRVSKGTIDTRCRSPVSRHPVTHDRPALPEMRYRDRSAPSKIGQPYPKERSMGSMGSLFRALFLSPSPPPFSFSLSLFFSFSLSHSHCVVLSHFLDSSLRVLFTLAFRRTHSRSLMHKHAHVCTHSHTLSLSLLLLLSRDELVPASRWPETPMPELVPILKRSSPPLPLLVMMLLLLLLPRC